MKEITFKRTSNVFLNTGIIALHDYLERCASGELSLNGYTLENNDFILTKDSLTIKHNNLFQLLEDVYYLMGKEVYDTISIKQEEDCSKGINCNLYFDTNTKNFIPFPRIKNYGLPYLLTNGRPKNTVKKENQSTIDKLKIINPELAEQFEKEFLKRNLELGSVIYFNEPYTTIPRLEKIETEYFQSDAEKQYYCSLTGESYNAVVDINNNSAFISKQGKESFKSFLKQGDNNISWKSMYLSRFSPVFCLYKYYGQNTKEEILIGYFIESNNLLNTQLLLKQIRGMFKDKLQIRHYTFSSNFNIYNFHTSKDNKEKLSSSIEYTEQSEVLFMLIYTVYRMFLFNYNNKEASTDDEDFDPMRESSFVKVPILLSTFSSTKKLLKQTHSTTHFENFDNFKYSIWLISEIEKYRIDIKQLLDSLKFLSKTIDDKNKEKRIERQLRAAVLNKILNKKSILNEISSLFYNCFSFQISSKIENKDGRVGFKNYDILRDLVKIYEPIIYAKGNIQMKEEAEKLQEKAIKLGSSIGLNIINYEDAKTPQAKITNAKNGRGYIISLHKARNFTQFTEAIIRFQKKYGLVINSELLNTTNEGNFNEVKQFAIIGALNIINSTLYSKKEENETK